MARSRFILIILILAYLGVTLAGVYTCACLVPADPVVQQVGGDDFSEKSTVKVTAVSTLIEFFPLAFAGMMAFLFADCRKYAHRWQFQWHNPPLFSQPPPTPPPHFV